MKNLFNLTCAISLAALCYGTTFADELGGEIQVNKDGSYEVDRNTTFTNTATLTLGAVNDLDSNPTGTILKNIELDNAGLITSLPNSSLIVEGKITNQSTGILDLAGKTLLGGSVETEVSEEMKTVLNNIGACNISGDARLPETREIINAGTLNICKGANFIAAGNITCTDTSAENGLKFDDNIIKVSDALFEIRSSSTVTTKTPTELKGIVKIDGKLTSEDNLTATGVSKVSGSGTMEVFNDLTLEPGADVKISRLHLMNINSKIINHGGKLQILEVIDLPDNLPDGKKFLMPLIFNKESLNMEANKATANTMEKYIHDQAKEQFKAHFDGMLDIMGSSADINTESENATTETIDKCKIVAYIDEKIWIPEINISAHHKNLLEYLYPETEIPTSSGGGWKYFPQGADSDKHLLNLASPYIGIFINVNISDADPEKSKRIEGSLISLEKSINGIQLHPISLRITSTDDQSITFSGVNSLYKGDLIFDLSYEADAAQTVNLIFNGKYAFPGGGVTIAPSNNKVNVRIASTEPTFIKVDEGTTIDFSNANSLVIDQNVHFKIFGVLK